MRSAWVCLVLAFSCGNSGELRELKPTWVRPAAVLGTELEVSDAGSSDEPVRFSLDVEQHAPTSDAAVQVLAAAADPSGNVYVASRSEGRLTLCRASDCVSLPRSLDAFMDDELRLDQLIARDRGVLFARSGKYLLRFDFPHERR